MEKKDSGGFKMFVNLSGTFVGKHKGMWNHNDWLNFLFEIQKRGIDVSEDMKLRFGYVLESMKKVYNSLSKTEHIENIMVDISHYTIDFFKNTGGIWSQTEWEKFLNNVQKKGINLNDEIRAYLMEFLINIKDFYSLVAVQTQQDAEEIVEDLTESIMLPHGLKELTRKMSSVSTDE